MKRIKLSLICSAALLMALSLTGCMGGDSGNADKHGTEQRIETRMDENTQCPDGDCDEKRTSGKRLENDGKCPDGKCPEREDECPDGRCPEKPSRGGKHGRGRVKPLPCPRKGN